MSSMFALAELPLAAQLVELSRQHQLILQQLEEIRAALQQPEPCPLRAKRIPLPHNQHSVEYLALDQIAYIEAERQYCVFHTLDRRRITTSKNIGAYARLLDEPKFMRVHRSRIVNLEQVRRFHRDEDALELSDGRRVAVSRNLRDAVLTRLRAE